jgi:hypothetical protein
VVKTHPLLPEGHSSHFTYSIHRASVCASICPPCLAESGSGTQSPREGFLFPPHPPRLFLVWLT